MDKFKVINRERKYSSHLNGAIKNTYPGIPKVKHYHHNWS